MVRHLNTGNVIIANTPPLSGRSRKTAPLVMKDHFRKEDIQHQLTLAGESEQNGKAERLNRTLVERGLSMLHTAKLPLSFWTHAFLTANHLRNRTPTHHSGSATPYQLMMGAKPNLTNYRIFGSNAWVFHNLIVQHI
jgi:histone deacetylase 1/2